MGEKGIASGFAVMGVAAAIIVPFTDFIRLWAFVLVLEPQTSSTAR